MKQTISILLVASMFYSCGNSDQNKASQVAKEIQATVKAGAIATTSGGYSMKAKLEGKDWVATSMMPPDATGRLIGYYENEYMGLPYDRRYLVEGKKIAIDENHAVDLAIANDCLWKDAKGEMTITKVDGNAAEGTFAFTVVCSSTGKTVTVTDGFFRIPLKKN